MSSSTQELPSRIDAIAKSLTALSGEVLEDEVARKKLLATLHQAESLVESPIEVIWRMIMEVCESAHVGYAMLIKYTAPSKCFSSVSYGNGSYRAYCI